jgi:NADPH2 dehydrogenase
VPGLFEPIEIRGLKLENRIMVSPMCQYQAREDGVTTDWHLVHYGSLALGGAGLVMLEATAVESRGRISKNDVGLYSDEHIPNLRRIVQFAHEHGTKIGIQLAHAGRKADLEEDIVAPSAIRFNERYKVPHALTASEMDDVTQAFVAAAKRAIEAGFDCVEVHAAHGYLLHEFLSPYSNQRTDEYGGSREGRLRFPLQVVRSVRQAIPDSMPLFVRVSASEYLDEGYTMEDMIFYCSAFRDAGADIIDASSGGNAPVAPPNIYAGYQVPFADTIRREVGIPTVAVGMLEDPVLADSVVREGRADMVAIARGFLRDKHWAHNAALRLNQPVHPPKPYARAYPTT